MRPCGFILTIGNEVLKGTVLNSNAQFLGRELTALGFEVMAQASCRDQIDEIQFFLALAMRQADLIFVSGGLGPTPDDLTRDAIADYFKSPLVLSSKQLRFIQNYYRARRKKMPPIVKKEAMFPKGALPLFNHYDIALGFSLKINRKMLFALPGVPYELVNMFSSLVIPAIKKEFVLPKRYSLIFKTVGISEPDVMKKLGRDFFRDPFDFGIYPHPGEVTVRIYSEKSSIIRKLKSKVLRRLKDDIYSWSDQTLSAVIGEILKNKKQSLAIAESCTGGLLTSMFTQVPGSSHFFKGAVTAYQKSTKRWLGISDEILRSGVISDETALALAKAIQKNLSSDYAIGITGVAGPLMDEKKPVGRVHIAVLGPGIRFISKENFLGNRQQIQTKAAIKALEYLWRLL